MGSVDILVITRPLAREGQQKKQKAARNTNEASTFKSKGKSVVKQKASKKGKGKAK